MKSPSEEANSGPKPGSDELINQLVQENMGWATSIAKSVARAWNLDWQLDGIDGGAFEALLFCARRYDPARGVPFRGYARRRIHEASTEEARNSKAWQRGTGVNDDVEGEAREISAKLFDLFPELRDGLLPVGGEEESFSVRSSIRQLLAGASMVAAFSNAGAANPETAVEYKVLVGVLSRLDSVHQEIVWAIYYKGLSMRSLAEEWEIDDLSVIREHKVILDYLSEALEAGRLAPRIAAPKVRRGLRTVAQRMKKQNEVGVFSKFISGTAVTVMVCLIVCQLCSEFVEGVLW